MGKRKTSHKNSNKTMNVRTHNPFELYKHDENTLATITIRTTMWMKNSPLNLIRERITESSVANKDKDRQLKRKK